MTANPLSQIVPVKISEGEAAPTLQELMTEFLATVSYNTNLGESKKWNGLHWKSSVAPDSRVRLESFEHFNARGMHMVYGRGDHFEKRQPVFHMDIWQTRDRRLLARLWSRGSEVDWESLEVIGHDTADFRPQDERWVPLCLREHYENWVIANMNF